MQEQFIEKLRTALPTNQSLAQSISETLGISLNEAYKKIRNQSALTLQQMVKLSDRYQVSIMYQPGQQDIVSFSYSRISNQVAGAEQYLADLLKQLKLIHAAKEKHLTVVTDDIPLFHLFKYPELSAFKLFFWLESISDGPSIFDRNFIAGITLQASRELNQLYLEIPSTEIWSKDCIQGSLMQIRYAFEAGFIADKALAEELITQLRYCLTDMNMYAMSSKKTIDAKHSFNWYNCDVLSSIAYVAETNGAIACFNRFNTFNFLKTEDPEYCRQTKRWIQGLIRKSVSFSGQGEKHRNKYIYQAFQECDALIREIAVGAG